MSPRPYLPDMTPQQIQTWVKEQLEHLPRMARAPRETKPANVATSAWKNRHRVSVKLKPDNAANFQAFQAHTGLNSNESLNFILSAFFNG